MKPKKSDITEAQQIIGLAKKEAAKAVVGQAGIMDGLFRSLLANGHALIEGVPGIAKTLAIRALAAITSCDFKRIQFTVDLLPSDIIGITTYDERTRKFYTIKGPIFANFVLVDEVNRAPAKVQSALLEAMQERQTTIGNTTYPLPNPFFVIATQNPLETTGVYALAEAQIDRFLFKLKMSYPLKNEEQVILVQNIHLKDFKDFGIKPVLTPQKILKLQRLTKNVYLDKDIERYIIEVVNATRNPDRYNISLGKYIAWGASPRASIGLFIAAKADALLQGNNFVTPQNVKNIAYDVLRHRILLNFEGEAENIKTESIIDEVLSKIPVP